MSFSRRTFLLEGAALATFFAAAILLQYMSGAYQSEFGAHPDEPSHVVTSLMVRDYVASGIPQHPMRYAESYYAHYPKAALGHWPPVYYVLQAGWILVFPATRASILMGHALITALLAWLLFHWARDWFPAPVALAAGFWLLTRPLIEWLTSAVMLDVAVALFTLLAALAFADYVHSPGTRAAAWFGFWSIAAIMTKGTGIVLALLPPICILLARRVKLPLRLSFWLPAIMVVAACGPWYWFGPEALQQSSGAYGAPSSSVSHWASMIGVWASRLGAPLVALAAIGIVANRRAFRLESRRDARWVAGVAFLCSALIFLSVVRSASEIRNVAMVMTPLMLFATAGVVRLVEWIPLRPTGARWRLALTVAILAVWSGANAIHVPGKPPAGYAQAASDLVSAPQYKNSVFLVSGDPADEGMFISEVALAEPRPSHIVLRATKMLSMSDWSGWNYSTGFQTVEAMDAYLRGIPVGILVLQSKPGRRRQHHDLLLQMVESRPQSWRRLGSYPRSAPGNATEPKFQVYELVGHQAMPRKEIRVRLTDKLGKDVKP